MTIKAHKGQSIFDICLMTYTSFENLIKLIQDSNFDNVNNDDTSEKIFTFDESLIADKTLFNAINSKGIFFNTLQDLFGQVPIINGITTDDGIQITTDDGESIIIS